MHNQDMDKLAALRAFSRIASTGSFTKAAAQLDMPRSTVSKALNDLEAELGTKLVRRTTRNVSLTIEGAEYYQRVAGLLAGLDDADASLRKMGAPAKGRLRIDVPSALGNFVIFPALAEFRAQFSDIQLVVGVGDRPVNLIEEGVDCVIRGGKLADTTLVSRLLFNDPLVTCAAPGYLAKHGVPTSPSELERDHRIVGYFGGVTGELVPLRFGRKDETFAISRFDNATSDSTSRIHMMLAGMGGGQIHQSAIESHQSSGALVSVLDDWTNDIVPMQIMYLPSKQANARLRTFIDWVAAHFKAKRERR